jgi:DegV family protein with EDD domain
MKKVKIITDSACDLDIQYLNDLGVDVVPLGVHFGDESYKDRFNITTSEFYKKLKDFGGVPTTSQVAPTTFEEVFKKSLEKGYHIIYLGFSSKLSGTFQSGNIAKGMLESEDIDTIDTKSASVGQGLIVREAALMARDGKSKEEIIDRVTYMRDKIQHIFAVGSLDMLKKGGRISTTQAVIGTILNVKPILQFEDGSIVPYDKVRGTKAIIKKMIDTMKERGYEIEKQVIGLSYSSNIDFCMEFKEEIQKEFGVKEFVISEIGAVIGSHVGPGTLALFFLGK